MQAKEIPTSVRTDLIFMQSFPIHYIRIFAFELTQWKKHLKLIRHHLDLFYNLSKAHSIWSLTK